MEQDTIKPDTALKQPMMWLVIGLPAAVVIAGFATLAIAILSGGSDAIPDEVRRTAQIQVADLDADALAHERNLSAVILIGKDAIEVVPVSGDFDRNASLRLTLIHPARAAEDRTLDLRGDGTRWRIATKLDARHDWRIQLASTDNAWRLRGRLPAGQRAARLAPALDGD